MARRANSARRIFEALCEKEAMYQFPVKVPKESQKDVEVLQNFLMTEAEKLMGNRSKSKITGQTQFAQNGPYIMNSFDRTKAWAVISNNAAGYWPTALYELAHETVHLLDPVVGYTNYLEEGIAVAFSVDMSRHQTNHPMSPTDVFYSKAYDLVKLLPVGIYNSAMAIRLKCGSLGAATIDDLKELFPKLESSVITELCSECNFT
jgi:hypothetical protein